MPRGRGARITAQECYLHAFSGTDTDHEYILSKNALYSMIVIKRAKHSDQGTSSSPPSPLSNTRPNAVLPHATPSPRLFNWVCGNDVPARTPPSIGGGELSRPDRKLLKRQAYRSLSYLSPSTLPRLSHFLLVDLSLTANSDPHLKAKYLNSILSA